MKTRKIIVSFLISIVFLATGYAKEKTKYSPELEKRITMALNSAKENLNNKDNLGLRNDAIYQIVRIKSLHPETDLDTFKKKLGKMSMNDPQLMIRTHAFLALAYLSDDRFVSEMNLTINIEEPEIFFEKVDHIIHTEFWANIQYDKDSGVFTTLTSLE